MKYLLPLLILTSLLITSPATPQNPAEPQKALYQTRGDEASLIGTINVKGPVRKPVRIDMAADPICVQLAGKAVTEHLIVNENKLVNVFVYVKNRELFQTYRFDSPTSEVILERQNCRFVPRMLAVRVNQPIIMRNSDRTHHNTHPTPRLNKEWNRTQPPGAEPLRDTFTRPEVLIPFKCNQHPWERAYVAVMDHPFFAISDGFGNYEISGLPHGTYTLVAWHEDLGEQEMELTLVAGESRRVDFTFDGARKPTSSQRD